MASVNATRRGIATNLSHAVEGAKMIGFNSHGEACVWFGGYGFNVYDAARQWHEVRHFTSGKLAGLTDKESDKGRLFARQRMRSEGFEVVE